MQLQETRLRSPDQRLRRPGRAERRWQGRYVLSSIAAAVIGLSLSCGAWYTVSHRENRLADTELRALANNHALILENGIKEYISKVAALHALFEADDEVKRGEFQAFANSILRDQTAILAV
jgi:CHASE1-domain containing sensor protein